MSFHLLRFPHLILENGGGAFLILFFIILNLLALPLIIAEKILDNKLDKIDLKSLLNIKKTSRAFHLDKSFFFLWYGLRILVLVCFLWLFLFLSGQAAHYLFYYLKTMVTSSILTSDLGIAPNINMSLFGASLWTTLSFIVFLKYREPFFKWSNQWALPSCFTILFILFLKIILSVQDYNALKNLFYPDFSALNSQSLSQLVGHATASLFVGLGFYKLLKVEAKVDLVEIFINAIIQALCLAVLIGVMALPMIDQVSETAFGSNWIFTILPRWLSYGKHGYYFCALFFLSICYVSFHVSVLIWRILNHNVLLSLNLSSNQKLRWISNISFLIISAVVVYFMQRNFSGWSGQSLLLTIDNIIVVLCLPVISLMLLWIVFRYSRKSEQSLVFEQQQLFYHNRYFFKIWRVVALGFVPFIIILGWLLILLEN